MVWVIDWCDGLVVCFVGVCLWVGVWFGFGVLGVFCLRCLDVLVWDGFGLGLWFGLWFGVVIGVLVWVLMIILGFVVLGGVGII